MGKESARGALYARLEEVLGDECAETLVSSLPTYPLSEVATKTDINRREARFDRLEDRFDRLEERFEHRLDGMVRTFLTTTVGR